MKFHRWSTGTIEDLAKLLNPKLSGWVNYYGKYGKSELSRVFRILHSRLIKWVINRYKSLKGSIKRAYAYLKQLQKGNPIFYHWKKGFINL
jgi:RNA-directed DNA polymerase